MAVRRRIVVVHMNQYHYTKMRLHPIVAYKKEKLQGKEGTEICRSFLHNTECSVRVTCSINKKYLQVQGGPRSILTDPVPAYCGLSQIATELHYL